MIEDHLAELLELAAPQRLGEDVGRIVVCRDELRADRHLLDQLADLKVTTLDVLGLGVGDVVLGDCLLYTSPSPRDRTRSRMPSSA